MHTPPITIIGAGLSGTLLAICLAQKGFNVTVYERRADMRLEHIPAGRSINLALSSRGIHALKQIGLEQQMVAIALPMHERCIHTIGNAPVHAAYSGRQGEYINSISRSELNIALLNEANKYSNITIHFNHTCTQVQVAAGIATFTHNHTTITASNSIIIGTDGAGSALRNAFEVQVPGFTHTQDILPHGYKELNIPPLPNGDFALSKSALHIWPRGSYMCIALPNPSGDFTVTLFLSKQDSTPSFEQLSNPEAITQFFTTQFPEIAQHIPNLVEQYLANPVGQLGTLLCAPYHYKGQCLLLGDAAHAIVPFYGQGMNCSFEDVMVLSQLINDYGTDFTTIFELYTSLRKPNCDAIAQLAIDNFYEMRDATANPTFQLKRQVETKLEQLYPNYYSKYSMVTFRHNVPYNVARDKGRAQDDVLMQYCSTKHNLADVDLDQVHNLLLQLK